MSFSLFGSIKFDCYQFIIDNHINIFNQNPQIINPFLFDICVRKMEYFST